MKIEPWCDSAEVLKKQKRVYMPIGEEYRECEVLSASVSGRFVLMTLSGIDSRESAQSYKNRVIYLHRSDIPVPKGAALIADMIGLPVIDIDTGRVYGSLSEVNDGVQAKLYTVKTDKGEVILPGIPQFIKEIDTERGIFVSVIPGFFED